MRRDFFLSEEDIEQLNARGLQWETINEGCYKWLLVHEFPTHEGYNVRTATAAIQIPSSYPMEPLDMVYFYPALCTIDGATIPNADCPMNINGIQYQRWSRHRTQQNPWRCGLDNISAHLSLVEEWLEREFKRG